MIVVRQISTILARWVVPRVSAVSRVQKETALVATRLRESVLAKKTSKENAAESQYRLI